MRTTSAYDRWLTRVPEPPEEPVVTCPAECAEEAGEGVPQEYLRAALAWEEVSRREIPVWGCSGLPANHEALGWDSAICGSTEPHERHEETVTARTFKSRCPVCGEEIRFEEEVY